MYRFHMTHPYLLDQTGYLNALAFDRWCEQKLKSHPPHHPDCDLWVELADGASTEGLRNRIRLRPWFVAPALAGGPCF